MLTLAVMTFPFKAWADEVNYLDANGIEQTANAQSIVSSVERIVLTGGWYYVSGNVTAPGLEFNGDANIILCDEAKMTLTNPDESILFDGIYAYEKNLAIYGQRYGTGSLTITGDNHILGTYVNKINIFGGTIKAEGNGGIWAYKDVIIIGGQVTAIATATEFFGIRAGNGGGDIILGWTNADDFINANSYKIGGTGSVKTAAGKRFVAYNMASDDDISANCIIGDASSTSATAIDTDISLDDANAAKTIAGKTLKPLDGYTVSTTDNKISLKNGTTAKNVDFTITTGTGSEAVTTSYYIYPASTSTPTTITLGYSGEVPTGYVLKYTATKTSDNSDVTSTVISGSTLTMPAYDISVSATLKTIIPSVAITDITAPVTLSAFDTQATCSTTGVTSNSVAWKNGSTTVTGNVAVGIAYTVEVTLMPTSDYTFTSTTTATINGNTATPSLNANGTLTVAYTFPATTKLSTSISTAPTASDITYGETLESSTLSGGSASVQGTFAWTNKDTKPNVSDSQTTPYSVTFTPNDATNYNTATTTVKLTVNKGTLEVSGKATATAEYGTQVKDISISGLTVTYGDSQVDGNWAFANTCTDVPAVGGTTAYTATFTPSSGAGNYNTLTQDIVPTIYAYTVSLGEGTGDAKDWTITDAGNAITPPSVVSPGNVVTLSYTGSKPENYNIGGYIVKDADGDDVNVTETDGVFSFNMPAKSVTIYGVKYYMTNVSYIGWDGANKDYITDAKTPDGTKVWVLTGTETTLGTANTEIWYVSNTAPSTANENKGLFYDHQLTLNGDVHLILADGSKMTVGTAEIPISDSAIYGDNPTTFTIYGQSTDAETMGSLTVSTESSTGIYAYDNIIINGGDVDATATYIGIGAYGPVSINGGKVKANLPENLWCFGIYSSYGDITINGGQVTAVGSYGIKVNSGDIILGWKNPDDFILASSYSVDNNSKVKKIADGKIFQYTEGEGSEATVTKLYEGTVTASIGGKTLTPYGYGGYCGSTANNADGKNLTWEIPLGSDGQPVTTLTISGTGEMADYANADNQPWKNYRDDITSIVVESGVTAIDAINGFNNLELITINSNSLPKASWHLM